MSRILLVEDDPVLQFLLEKILEQDCHQLTIAGNGSEAMALLNSLKPDLVILDIMLPDISGFELLDAFRKLANLVELPIIMFSAKSANEDVLRALQHGANDYIYKPANHQELRARVAIQLQIRQLAINPPGPQVIPETL